MIPEQGPSPFPLSIPGRLDLGPTLKKGRARVRRVGSCLWGIRHRGCSGWSLPSESLALGSLGLSPPSKGSSPWGTQLGLSPQGILILEHSSCSLPPGDPHPGALKLLVAPRGSLPWNARPARCPRGPGDVNGQRDRNQAGRGVGAAAKCGGRPRLWRLGRARTVADPGLTFGADVGTCKPARRGRG